MRLLCSIATLWSNTNLINFELLICFVKIYWQNDFSQLGKQWKINYTIKKVMNQESYEYSILKFTLILIYTPYMIYIIYEHFWQQEICNQKVRTKYFTQFIEVLDKNQLILMMSYTSIFNMNSSDNSPFSGRLLPMLMSACLHILMKS